MDRVSSSHLGVWILGQFRLQRVLGTGGMGTVYLAEQPSMGRHAAVKLVPPGPLDGEAVSRFRQEARTASQLCHPNIVPIYNFGELADGHLFMAMQYIDGPTVAQLLREEGALHPLDAIDIALQCAEALHFAHEHSVLHRDVKPANVMLRRVLDRWHVMLVDFGLARLPDDQALTLPGVVLGTPQYMSPEQCCGAQIGLPSDQYGLGLVLYEMLTGTQAVAADSAYGYLWEHQNTVPPPPSQRRPDPAVELTDTVVSRMLAKEPDDRYPDAALCDVLCSLHQAMREEFSGAHTLPPTAFVGDDDAVSASTALSGRAAVVVSCSEELARPEEWERVIAEAGYDSAVGASNAGPAQDVLSIVGVAPTGWERCEAPESPMLAWLAGPPRTHGLAGITEKFPRLVISERPPPALVLAIALKWLERPFRSAIEIMLARQHRPIQVVQIKDSAHRSDYVDSMLADARAHGLRRRPLRLLAELGEEMVTNAIFHAPVDDQGEPRYAQLRRDERVTLEDGAEATLSWNIGEEWIAVAVSDPFGALCPSSVIERVTGADRQPSSDGIRGSAGMGLSIMGRAARHLMFVIRPGKSCEILALIERELPSAASPRTLTVLNAQTRGLERVGDRLGAIAASAPSALHVELRGDVNETSDLAQLYQYPGRVVVDLSRVERINSGGIRAWLDASKNPPDEHSLVLERCSPAMVSQINMVSFFTSTASVVSLMAPYFCQRCGEEVLELLQVDEIKESAPPERHCRACSELLRFEELAEEYFAFLEA